MKKILVVDDILVNRILLNEIIKKINCQSIEATNGKDAIEVLQRETIDIVLMDIEMPVMNGIEATKHIREKLPYPINRVPIIAITAHNPAEFVDNFEQVGFDQLMTKPYSVEKVMRLIDSIHEKKINLNK